MAVEDTKLLSSKEYNKTTITFATTPSENKLNSQSTTTKKGPHLDW